MNSGTSKLKRWQRIYVNRSINLGHIHCIGFDMDHTLAQYNREAFEALAFNETLKKFIEAGYPEELLKLRFNPTSVIRGLMVDKERGNILKMDGHKYVKTAYHGDKELSKSERHELYNRQRLVAKGFLSVDSFFALSEVQLFKEIVSYMSKNPKKIKKSFTEVYEDLRKFIDQCHADGSIKDKVVRNPEQYFFRDKFLAKALIGQIEGGKILFLLTNSNWDYTNVVMTYNLAGMHEEFSDWRSYFSYIIVGASKPRFFVENQPFYEVDTTNGMLRPHKGKLKKNTIYHGGNVNLFQKLTGYKGDEILYVGDHVYGDIIRSKDIVNWRTLLIIEELADEIPKLEALKAETAKIKMRLSEKEEKDEELQLLQSNIKAATRHLELCRERGDDKRASGLEREISRLSTQAAAAQKSVDSLDQEIRGLINHRSAAVHPIWGELMKCGLTRSRFADQVEDYACLYTSRVTNLRFYSPFKRFTSVRESMPHDEGIA